MGPAKPIGPRLEWRPPNRRLGSRSSSPLTRDTGRRNLRTANGPPPMNLKNTLIPFLLLAAVCTPAKAESPGAGLSGDLPYR